MIKELLSVGIMAFIIGMPFAIYKYSTQARVNKTNIQLEIYSQEPAQYTNTAVDFWNKPIKLQSTEFYNTYTSAGPDREFGTADDIIRKGNK